jgi:DNA modification methylase
MTFEVVCGDAFEELKKLKPNSVDVVFTSPDPPETAEAVFDLSELCSQIWPILKNTCSLFVELGDYHNDDGSMGLVPERFAVMMEHYGWILRNKLIWWRPSNTPHEDKTRFKRDWETLFWYTKLKAGYYFKPNGNIHTSVFKLPYIAPKRGEFDSGFPIALVDLALSLTCPPSGTVLDPFAGTGVTGISALKHGCHFIGIEKNPNTARKLSIRLNSHMI